MKTDRNIYLLFFISLFLFSCKKENTAPDPSTSGSEYFSAETGMSRIYQVDSIYWDEFSNTHDTISYKVKEIIPSTYMDNQGRITQKIERYRQDSTGSWQIWKVWSSNVTTTTAEQVEDNIRYIKLTFTPAINATWNGNAYNTGDVQQYQIITLDQPDVVGNLSFESTLTVKQVDSESLLDKYYSEERYAKGAGLYYRHNEELIKVFNTPDIRSGYIYNETLLSYSITP